jgi:2-polyprenyl-3-methyl-5-hydroxy-6-metoxy-1,4-benzoquinol methylase
MPSFCWTRSGLNESIEHPAIWRLIPPSLSGAHILDLGCGFGDFARQGRIRGAAALLGIDVSQRILGVARSETHDSCITYRRWSIEGFESEAESFGVAVACLTLHYVADYQGALKRIFKNPRRGRPVCILRRASYLHGSCRTEMVP